MKNKGFSLVELIVVIAIMAILVGVAVPVYTSYIEKAQKSKDEQMVDEIKHAIEIAAVGDNWNQSVEAGNAVGSIVLKNGKPAVVTGDLLVNALKATFGDDYASKLQLSYDGWTGTLNAENIDNIVNSSFNGNTDILLGDIQKLTNSLKDFINTGAGSAVMGSGFDTFLTELRNSGVDVPADDAQKMANAAILYVAQNTGSISKAEDPAAKNALVDLWATNNVGSLGVAMGGVPGASTMTLLAAEYARAEAIIAHLNCAEARTAFTTHSIGGADANAVMTSLGAVLTEVDTHIRACPTCPAAFDSYFADNGPARKDALAYFALLEQVESSEDLVISNLGSDKLYSNEDLLSHVNGYISAAELMSNAEEGDVAITVVMTANGNVDIKVYPLDYNK